MGKDIGSTKGKANRKLKDARHRVTLIFGDDGVHICGRIGSALGIVALALMVIGCLMPDWSKTSQLGGKGSMEENGLEEIKEATFGLGFYCLGTKLTGFTTGPENANVEDHAYARVCFGYDDSATIVPEAQLGNSSYVASAMTGCDRFSTGGFSSADPCSKRIVIILIMTGAICLTVFGDAVSEKPKLNGLMLSIGGALMILVLIIWSTMIGGVDANEAVEPGDGMYVIIGAAIAAAIAAFANIFDGCCCFGGDDDDDDDGGSGAANMCDFDDDGIELSGRAAAFLSAATWILFLGAALTNDWSHTSDLGQVGSFCSSPDFTGEQCTRTGVNGVEKNCKTVGCIAEASFGLLEYCVYPQLPTYSNRTVQVCYKWDDIVDTPGNKDYVSNGVPCSDIDGGECGNVSATRENGYDRMSKYDVKSDTGIVFYWLIGAVVAVSFGDIFSEKLALCAALNFLGAFLGIVAMFMWVEFINKLGADTEAQVVYGYSGWLLICGIICGVFTGVLYFKDWCNNGCGNGDEYEDDDDDEKGNDESSA